VSDWLKAPEEDEIEVTLFGPGKGECVVVHIGGGEWIVMDSCLGKDREPAAATYLESLGVDLAGVKLLVVSHWHDDHIGGLARLVELIPGAGLVCSGALAADEFLYLVSAADLRPMVRTTSGVHEFRRVIETLDSRKQHPRFAIQDRVLYRRSNSIPCVIQALSPSDASNREGFEHIRDLLGEQGQGDRLTVPRPERNPAAVVVWVDIGGICMLLSSDLEVSVDAQKGWTALLNAPARPTADAEVIKVSHHGSINGHDDEVWRSLVKPAPHAVLTPYLSGSTPLPRPSDIERIARLTPHAYLTRPSGTPKVKRDWRVSKMTEDATRWIRASEPPNAGAIRLRRRVAADASWRVRLSGSAIRLSA